MPSSLEHLRTFSQTACGLLAPTHEHVEIFCAECAKKIGNANVWSIAGAPKRGAMRALIIYVCEHEVMATSMNKQRGKRTQMLHSRVSAMEHLWNRELFKVSGI